MTVSELRNAIADHFDKLYLHKIGRSALVLGAGVLVVVSPSAISVYEISREKCDVLISELLVLDEPNEPVTVQSPLGQLICAAIDECHDCPKLTNFNLDCRDAASLSKMDELVSRKLRELMEVKREKWAYR
jgi:hypothetical protein